MMFFMPQAIIPAVEIIELLVTYSYVLNLFLKDAVKNNFVIVVGK
jgi:hypothetical protein